MSPVKRPPPKVQDAVFKEWISTKKDDSVVLGPIKRMLIEKRALDPYEGRPQNVIHPSELVKDDWCARAEYFKLSGVQPKKIESIHFNLETVFGEGHLIHTKYQNWLWDVGMLQGNFSCEYCGFWWWGESPTECARPGCVGGREVLVYREVPVQSDKYMIGGHADGELIGGRDGIEVKSIGIGTLRHEHPELLATHTHEFPDGTKQIAFDDLWRGIQRPLPAHYRQGQVYGVIRGWERAIYIYECKWNQRTKEFVVRINPEMIEDVLEQCLDVKYALEEGKPPRCTGPKKEEGDTSCASCKNYEPGERDGEESAEADHSPRRRRRLPTEAVESTRPDGRERKRGGASPSRVGEEGTPPPRASRVRRPTAAGRFDRSR